MKQNINDIKADLEEATNRLDKLRNMVIDTTYHDWELHKQIRKSTATPSDIRIQFRIMGKYDDYLQQRNLLMDYVRSFEARDKNLGDMIAFLKNILASMDIILDTISMQINILERYKRDEEIQGREDSKSVGKEKADSTRYEPDKERTSDIQTDEQY